MTAVGTADYGRAKDAIMGAVWTNRARPGKVYRGSRRRLRRIKVRDNTPFSLVLTAAMVLALMIFTIAWLIQHLPAHHD